jgi:hypothetical protein
VQLLNPVLVMSSVPAIVFKEDTVEYKADSFNVKKEGDAEDLLKRLPGVHVRKDGTVIAQGKIVTKIKVNGKDFFTGNSQETLQSIPANAIDKVQVINDYGEAEKLTGFKNGSSEKIINLVLKKDKKQGFFVKLKNGLGSNLYYDFRNSFNYFTDDRQLSVYSTISDLSKNTFVEGLNDYFIGSLTNLIRLNNSATENLGGQGAVSSMLTNEDYGFTSTIPDYGNGVSDNFSTGIRYSENSIKNTTLYGSYIYYHDKNQVQTNGSGLEFIGNNNSFYQNSNLNSTTKNSGHRFYFKLEKTFPSGISIRIIPTINIRPSNGVETNNLINSENAKIFNTSFQKLTTDNTNNSSSIDLLFKWKLPKSNQALIFESVYTQNSVKGSLYSKAFFFPSLNFDTSSTLSSSLSNAKTINNRLSYSFPALKKASIELSYLNSIVLTEANRNTYFFDSASNNYVFNQDYSGVVYADYYMHLFGGTLKIPFRRKMNLYVGIFGQYTDIARRSLPDVTQYHFSEFDFVNTVTFNYKTSSTNNLELKYSSTVVPPDPSYVLPIADTSNPLSTVKGNIQLKTEHPYSLDLEFYKFDISGGNLFLMALHFQKTINKIVPDIIFDSLGKSLITFTNANYNLEAGLYHNFSMPFNNKLIELTWGGNISFERYSYVIATLQKVNTLKVNETIEFTYNKDWMESSLGIGIASDDYLYLNTPYTATNVMLNEKTAFFVFKTKMGMDLNLIKMGNYYITHPKYIFLANAYAETKIAKRISIRVDLNDIFNEASLNITRTFYDNYLTDNRYNVRGRYLLFSLIYKFSKF